MIINRLCKFIVRSPVKLIVLAGFLFSCQRISPTEKQETSGAIAVAVPDYFPPVPLAEDDTLTLKKIELGKRLFFDPILSRHRDLSCGSCHLPNLAFTDGKIKSINVGGEPTLRNSPSLLNVGYHPYFFMDGGNPTLESQMIGPIENHLEMDLPFPEAMQRVADDSTYIFLFQEAYNAKVSPFTLTHAIAAYERTLVSHNSPFDKWYYQKQENAISEDAKAGYALFTSDKLKCSSCHSGVLFTDFEFRNNGLKDDYGNDQGRGRITLKPEDEGKFKTPSLRNVALTAPFMHDGSLATLKEVIDHYASGGENHQNRDSMITGFEISEKEKQQLIQFLESLTDTSSHRSSTLGTKAVE